MSDMNFGMDEEFYFKGNNTGILLVHGFTGTPAEVRLLGDFLKDKGYTVKGILLKGHGTDHENMKNCTYRDWIREAVEGYKSLKQECDEVFAVGLSMGGLLSLYLARNYDIRAVVSLSTPIRVRGGAAALSYVERNVNSSILRSTRKSNAKEMGCDKSSVKGVYNLFKLIKYVKANLKSIEKPVLIMQSYGDRTVSPTSANIIYNNIGSKDKSIVYLHNSDHIITCDKDKEQVFMEVYRFIMSKSAFKRKIENKEKRCNSVG